jgi:hypothetical protein
VSAVEVIELILAIVSLGIAVAIEVKEHGKNLGMWAMILCDVIWILRLVPAFHGT